MNNYKKIVVVAFLLIVINLVNILFIDYLNRYILLFILSIVLAIFFKMLGIEKNNHRHQKDIILQILIMSFIYYITTYVFGFFNGFVNNAYQFTIANIIKVIIPVILLIIVKETIRYIVCSKYKDKKSILILITFALILTDVTLLFNTFNLSYHKDLFTLISYWIFPSITRNILLTYLCLKVGVKTQIIYRLIIELPYYLIPILPDMDIYISSIIQTVLPLVFLLIFINSFQRQSLIVNVRKKAVISKVVFFIVLVFLGCLIALTSTYFKYFFLTIGSGSMNPNIKKGDIVVVKKCDVTELQVDDILVFKEGKMIIVHRVIELEISDDNVKLLTKGDNNENADSYYIEEEEVIGKVLFRIPYLGYPTVYLNELFK